MKTIFYALIAMLISLNFASSAFAGGGQVVGDLGPVEAAIVPEVSAPAAAAVNQAAPPEIDLFRYFGYAKSPRALELSTVKGTKGLEDTVVSVDLESIKNAYLKTAVSFTAGAGVKVHISGAKASNCPDGGDSCDDMAKFFLTLTTGNKTIFVRAKEILNWGLFFSGSKTVEIEGEQYVLKISADATAPENSRLEIMGPRGPELNVTLKQVGDAVARKGIDVKLSKAYKLVYSNEILQGPQGARFTGRMLVLMIPFPVADAAPYYTLKISDIRPTGTLFPSFEKGYGFKLKEGKLDIYML